MKNHRLLAGIALILPVLLPAAAMAQATVTAAAPDAAAASTPVEREAVPAGAILVTAATRTPTSIDRVPASITVLDKTTIDRMGDLSVADLLVRTPGVSLSRNGGYGTATQVRIRGAEADETVVVIDGVKLNDPSSIGGAYNFANLLTGDASRIEVLRGVQSTLWGSQAIGGVVNFVTPLPERALEGSVDLEGGSRDTVSARAAAGGRTGPLAWRVGGQTFYTRGISALAPAYGGREPDGYRNQSVAGRAVLDLATGISADVRGYFSNGRTDTDGYDANFQEVDTPSYALNREFVGYAGLNVALFDGRFRNRFAYTYTNTDRDDYDPTLERAQTFDGTGRNHRLEYQGTLAIVRGVDAVFGAENEVSRFRTLAPPASLSAPVPAPDQARAEITSVYGQINAQVLTGLTLTGGVRNDDHNRFGGQTLFSGGGVWALPTGTVIRASYSEGFKAPTLYQLFSIYGNQALRPERAKGWEAGVEQRFLDGAVTLGGTYFERRTRDRIDFAYCPSVTPSLCVIPGTTTPRFGYYANVVSAFAKGVEAVGHVSLGERLSLDANYSWIASEDRSPGAVPQQLLRRPRNTANASASYSVSDTGPSFGAAVRWSGETFDFNNTDFSRTRLSPYTLVDLRAEYPLSPDVRAFVRAENVLDESYRTIFQYGTLGRSIYAGLRGRF